MPPNASENSKGRTFQRSKTQYLPCAGVVEFCSYSAACSKLDNTDTPTATTSPAEETLRYWKNVRRNHTRLAVWCGVDPTCLASLWVKAPMSRG